MRRLLAISIITGSLGTSALALAFPFNRSWHEAATGVAGTNRAGAGGIYGTGGRTDHGVRCSHCHTGDRLGTCTDPVTGRIDANITVTPPFGMSGAAKTYVPSQRYTITIDLVGEHRMRGAGQLNGMAATIEDDSGQRAGRFITDSGADSMGCGPTSIRPRPSNIMEGHGGAGTTFVYGDCHGVLSVAEPGRARWTFDWVAPSGSSNLTLFLGVVDGDTGGESSLCDDAIERAIPLVPE